STARCAGWSALVCTFEASLEFGSDRPDFHGAIGGGRAARRPFQGCIERRQLEQYEAAQLLLGGGIRAVLHKGLAVAPPHGRTGFRRVQRFDTGVDTGFDKRLVVSAPGAKMSSIVTGRFPARKVGGRFIDEQRVLHRSSSVSWIGVLSIL